MVCVSTVERDVEIVLDDERNAGLARIVERREIRIGQLFQDGELRLWEDSMGWSGFLREDSDDGPVYYSVNRLEDGPRAEWLRKTRCGEQAVRNGIKEHIADPEAGGVGNFIRRCSPP